MYHRNVTVPSFLYYADGWGTEYTEEGKVSEDNVLALFVDYRNANSTYDALNKKGFLIEKVEYVDGILYEDPVLVLKHRGLVLFAIGHTDLEQSRALVRIFKKRGEYLQVVHQKGIWDKYTDEEFYVLEYKITSIPKWVDRDGCGPTQLPLFKE